MSATKESFDDRMKSVLEYFFALSRYPRRSGKEGAAVDYLESWARGAGFAVERDKEGNLLIDCPAFMSGEASPNRPQLILQAHIDMVCIADDPAVDLDRMVVSPFVEGGTLRAAGTTLGADNGIGIALAQHFATRPRTCPIRLVFTVDEEETMAGARALDPSWLDAPYLANLDSAFSDKLTVGAAGSCDVVVEKDVRPICGRLDAQGFEIVIAGLAGGHSGDDIGKGRSNAVRTALDVLGRLSSSGASWELASFEVSGASNALAACACIRGNTESFALLEKACSGAESFVRAACVDDAGARVECRKRPAFDGCIEDGPAYVELLRCLPEGILAAAPDASCPASLSSNIGTVALSPDGFRAECLIRFDSASECEKCLAEFSAAACRFGASLEKTAQSAPWVERAESRLADAYEKAYEDVVGDVPDRIVIHSAVECGELQLRNPRIDAISISPDIIDAHSVSERVDLASMQKIIDVLERLIDSDLLDGAA
ncbi:MAG: M20/M25/M40 family metallo-hydrolase [Slackia sp.]|nr:M20/M25/M40 family metallo-hydrolase [Slackia sp.]